MKIWRFAVLMTLFLSSVSFSMPPKAGMSVSEANGIIARYNAANRSRLTQDDKALIYQAKYVLKQNGILPPNNKCCKIGATGAGSRCIRGIGFCEKYDDTLCTVSSDDCD